ncbi:hypothetical protein SDRG_13179 [Saprolegnia diclina VS20]|uniref:Acyltransferase 3 domain-containing protein n=1 Tax=Saprolegnia diclina (strain VS20) TaxID=1156394 RepID=T0RA62_SAPDV|nr:hypothetical protein SDRG_13179 [Saprolegnia diclina VS20]EQC29023.1 hypothetical protein SDRG_13179 [Saprolegnia diclina VS20]|eukprot:XP_008617482.1 hypothetical protein SDRG_13179 [Saprolegnia diclina VS20]
MNPRNEPITLNQADVDAKAIARQPSCEQNPMATESTALLAPHAIAYRPDIDGLRCVAVLPVVLYHAYPTLLPGGFTGVDVFFVISGFLISSILFKDFASGKFSYETFYVRRVRRIFPSLLLVMAVVLSLSVAWYLAPALRDMAETLYAGAIFGANIQVLSRNQGYFDASTKENPLLHLWSLGVEEQFYMVWPIVAASIVALPRTSALALQIVLVVGSFLLNVGLLHAEHPWSFYFPLCRFWQMATGGLVAFVQRQKGFETRSPDMLSVLGAGLLLVGYAFLNEASPFPGVYALLPTLGAACLIVAGPLALVNAQILHQAPIIFVGKISYALYLWHWPLLVFAKARYSDDAYRPFYMQPHVLLLLAFGLSVATTFGIENVVRRHPSPRIVPLLALGMVLMAVLGLVVSLYPAFFSGPARLAATAPVATATSFVTLDDDGQPNISRMPRREPPTVAKLLAADSDWAPNDGYIPLSPGSPFGPYDYGWVLNPGDDDNLVMVLGDSHAEMLRPRFKFLYDQARRVGKPFPTVVFLALGGHPPLDCVGDHAGHVAIVTRLRPKALLYSSDWPQFFRPTGEAPHDVPRCCAAGYRDDCAYQSWGDVRTLLRAFQDEMTRFQDLGTHVFASSLNPEGRRFHYRNMLQGGDVRAIAPVRLSAYRHQHSRLVSLLEGAIRGANATIVDYARNQCYNDVCEVVSTARGEPILKDNDHYRPYYAKYYLSVLDQVVDAVYN